MGRAANRGPGPAGRRGTRAAPPGQGTDHEPTDPHGTGHEPPGRARDMARGIAIRVRPAGRGTSVGGRHEGPWGPALVVTVSAPAVDGRANQAAIRALADALGLRARDLTIRVGASSRDKLLSVTDPPADLASRIAHLRDGA